MSDKSAKEAFARLRRKKIIRDKVEGSDTLKKWRGLWATSPHLDQALDLGRGWGFDWATVGFIWNKMRTNPGFYTLSQCELCLIFKRGKIPQPRGRRDISQYVGEERGRHSEKRAKSESASNKCFPTKPNWNCSLANEHGEGSMGA